MRVFLFLFIFLLSPILVYAQEGEVEPTQMEYIALFANAIIAGVGVQLLKWKLLPWLKASTPYLIPIISMAVGIAGAWVMTQTGIDLSPIGNFLGAGIASGALASSSFAVIKEIDNKRG